MIKNITLLGSVFISMLLLSGCGENGSSSAKSNPTSQKVNTAPVATFDRLFATKGKRYDGELSATDVDGDSLKYIMIEAPKHGTVILYDNGCFHYTPERGFNGVDSFVYQAKDAVSACAKKRVTITVGEPHVEKPKAPSKLTIKALSSRAVELHWSDNWDDEEGFVIYQDGKLVATTAKNKTQKIISCGLEAATGYHFEVRAKNKAGLSDAIDAEITTKDVTTPPNAPSQLEAKAIGKTSLRLVWKDNADDESAYTIYQDGILIKTISSGCSCTVVTGLEEKSTYTFVVKAVNKVGSASSNTLTVTTEGEKVDEDSSNHHDTNSTQSQDTNTTQADDQNDTQNSNNTDNNTTTTDSNSTNDSNATTQVKRKNILFAHGYLGDKSSWNDFVAYMQENDPSYHIYRYSVGKRDSIATRATQLANDINQEANITDDSLIAVAHSMGGLDLRYIVAEGHKHQDDKTNIFYKAAKKIHNIYTLASPHKGINDVGVDDATKDMTVPNMKLFNEANPYSLFSIDDRKIPLLAMRFVCDEARISDGNGAQSDSGNDGLLKVKTQIFNGAPFTQSVFSGKHTDDTLCLGNYEEEKKRTDILQRILDKEKFYADRKDIVFFDDNECKGNEAGIFSSTYKVGGVDCLLDDGCKNNAIASMMIFPDIKKDTIIELYSDSDDKGGDDWAVIDIAQATLSKPLCVPTFEKDLPSEISDLGITLEYHPVDGGENGLDKKVSYINIK